VTTPTDAEQRVEVVLRRDAFDRDPHGFTAQWERHDRKIRRQWSARARSSGASRRRAPCCIGAPSCARRSPPTASAAS
jgi:Mg-chelatase subunit ChlI